MTTPPRLTGYIEGYYGRILQPKDRLRLITRLAELGMNAYLYAAKEDPAHRYQWRTPYSMEWMAGWRGLVRATAGAGITRLIGIAPGLDFDFDHENDFAILREKMDGLTRVGAEPCLMFDDIDPPPKHGKADDGGAGEGARHAALANRLADALETPLYIVPRIYADELGTASPHYLPALADTLAAQHRLFYCGSHIVSRPIRLEASLAVAAGFALPRLIAWDNGYANDYCPRRLFLGAWQPPQGKAAGGVMLNATGMPETDCLLLAIMAKGTGDKA